MGTATGQDSGFNGLNLEFEFRLRFEIVILCSSLRFLVAYAGHAGTTDHT